MTVEFNDCNYRWQLEDSLKDILDRMAFQAPEDFNRVAQVLLADKDNRSQLIEELSENLQSTLNNAFEYLDLPEDHINANYVKEHLAVFGLTTDNIKDLSHADFEKECLSAHQKIVKTYFQDQAAYFEQLTDEQKFEIIALKKQTMLDQEKAREIAKAATAKIATPVPGSENSNYNLFVTNLFGGTQRFNEILQLLKAESCLSECTDLLGKIQGVITDEDGIRWDFQLHGCATECNKLHFHFQNYDALNLIPEDETKGIAAQTIEHISSTNAIPKGEHQLSCSTIKDMLFNRIKQQTTCAYIIAYARAHGVSMDHIDRMLQKMSRENNVPSRAELKQKVLALQQPEQEEQPDILNLLGQLLGAQNGNHAEEPDLLLGNNPLLQLLGAMVPGLRIISMSEIRQMGQIPPTQNEPRSPGGPNL